MSFLFLWCDILVPWRVHTLQFFWQFFCSTCFFFRCKKIDSTYLKLCVWPSNSESKQTIIVTMSPQSHEKQQFCPPKNQLIYHKNRSTCRVLVGAPWYSIFINEIKPGISTLLKGFPEKNPRPVFAFQW